MMTYGGAIDYNGCELYVVIVERNHLFTLSMVIFVAQAQLALSTCKFGGLMRSASSS